MDLQFLLPLAAFLGMIAGIIVGMFSKEEFNTNRKYLLIFSRAVLAALIVYLSYDSGSLISFLVGLVAGFFLTATYLYLGLAVASTLASPLSFIVSSLVLLYGIFYGTLAFSRFDWKMVLLHLAVFLLPFSILMIWPGYSNALMSLSAGLLIGSLENKFVRRY